MTSPATPFPQQLVIETTAACDLACTFCGRTYMDRPKTNLREELFRKVVEEVGRVSPWTEVWPTFMGEALLLGPRIFEWVRHARSAGCRKITLNSNGNRLDDAAIDGVLTCGLDRFILSCDAHTPETYAKVRPRGRHDRLYGGAERLVAEHRRRGLERPILEMQFSVFDENEHEVEDFKRHWLARGVVVKTRPKLFWTGAVAGGDARVTLGAKRTPCLWSMETCAVQANGNVVACAVDCEGKYVAGNVETQSLAEIWNGPLRWVRELHARRRFRDLPEVCRRCTDWDVKRADAFFPDEGSRAAYVAYVRQGRELPGTGPADEASHSVAPAAEAAARQAD